MVGDGAGLDGGITLKKRPEVVETKVLHPQEWWVRCCCCRRNWNSRKK